MRGVMAAAPGPGCGEPGKGSESCGGVSAAAACRSGSPRGGVFFCSGPLVRYRVLEFILCLVLHVPEEPVCAVKCRFLTTRGTASRRSV